MNKVEPRIFRHVILQGEDEQRLREMRGAVSRLKPGPAHDAAAKAADDFAAEAEPRGVTVTLRSLGRKKWADLVKEHPPRDDEPSDVRQGVNLETFPEALVPACIAGPTFGEGELEEFLDSISPADFETLALGAWHIHKSLGADPKDRLLSVLEES